MNSIYEQLLFTTLRIKSTDTVGRTSIGTGFLLNRPIGEDQSKMYLVSNKHILSEAETIEIAFTKVKNGEPDIGNTVSFPLTNVKANVHGHETA